VLVFVQEGVDREPRQDAFVKEVQGWSRGQYTSSFSSPEDLQEAVTRAIHELELSKSAGPVDESELLARAEALLPRERDSGSPAVAVIVSGAPRQSIIRPAQLESQELSDWIVQAAMFGKDRVFDRSQGSQPEIENNALSIRQKHASILLTPLGDVRVVQPGYGNRDRNDFLPVLIDEEINESISRALRFAAALLDHVDAIRRLRSVAPVAAMLDARYAGWMTRSERAASRRSVTMGMTSSDSPVRAVLAPAVRPRAALGLQADAMAEDLTVLLRRAIRR
jgi:phage baseplate assembly protein W